MAVMASTTNDTSALDADKPRLQDFLAQRDALLREHNISPEAMREAWFIMAHMILDDDAHIVHMGCKSGEITFAMAALYPHLNFTGLDKDKRKITKANAKYELDNLDFKIGDATSGLFGNNSLDAVIDSNFLHIIYSGSDYNEHIVTETLAAHHRMLKVGGQIFMRDFARPPPEEYVLLELPDEESPSDDLMDLCDADLLLWYSENARQSRDPGLGGFFLEELPATTEGTRLFRLLHKWAYEFIMHKDEREEWENDLPMEYTFFTAREMRKSLRSLGMRVIYATSQNDEDIVRERFEGRFRLYKDDGTPMDYPSLSYLTIGVKVNERESLNIVERRPSKTDNSTIKIRTMRNDSDGSLRDVAYRDITPAEILPYRISKNGKLKIYLHDGLIRSIVNAVPRKGLSLTDQRWSGHMIEALSVDSGALPDEDTLNERTTQKFAQEHLGLSADNGAVLLKGPYHYPAPEYIDEQIQCYFLPVKFNPNLTTPLRQFLTSYRFTAKGDVREFDAQQILDAITVGVIPNARLELQILALFEHLKMRPENWTQKDIDFQISNLINPRKMSDVVGALKDHDHHFSDSDKSANELRAVHSIFVEEGQSRGAVTGLSHQDVDFIIHNEQSENIAVILPLTQGLQDEFFVDFNLEKMPIPFRYEGNGLTVTAPRYPLPTDVTTIRQAKKYLAEKLTAKYMGENTYITADNIIKMGEPYFTHIGMTPQKIYPFVVVLPPEAFDAPDAQFLPFYQMMLLRSSLSKDPHFMTLMARSYRYINDHLKLDAKVKARFMAQKSFDYQTPSLSMPLSYHRSPALSNIDEKRLMSLDVGARALEASKTTATHNINKGSDIPVKNNTVDFNTPKDGPHAANQPVTQQAAQKMKSLIQPFLKKPDPAKMPRLTHDFEKELDTFMEDLDHLDNQSNPRPEKW